jgi:ABC-2 type transport system ATP-binding protein/ribosome-dependent ATPase
MTVQPVLEADRVTMRFGEFGALEDVSIRVLPGEVVGLLGANGAGKTTLIRILLGLQRPTQGTTALLGGPPDRSRRSRLGYVPQGLGLYPDLTVRENLSFVAQAYGATDVRLPHALEGVAGQLVGDIGLGLQRQLSFTCALLHNPDVLVLDEPTSGVDAIARSRLWDVIRQRAGAGVGVLVTTHYMAEAQQCDRLVLLSGGRVVGEGDEAAIIGDTRAASVLAADWAAAFAALDARGMAVTLAGRSVRVADAEPDRIREILLAGGIPAEVALVPATIEERMTVLSRAQAS